MAQVNNLECLFLINIFLSLLKVAQGAFSLYTFKQSLVHLFHDRISLLLTWKFMLAVSTISVQSVRSYGSIFSHIMPNKQSRVDGNSVLFAYIRCKEDGCMHFIITFSLPTAPIP